MLRVRITSDVDQLITQAAESAAARRGSGNVSTWVRETLTAAARRELAKDGGGPKAAPNSTHDGG